MALTWYLIPNTGEYLTSHPYTPESNATKASFFQKIHSLVLSFGIVVARAGKVEYNLSLSSSVHGYLQYYNQYRANMTQPHIQNIYDKTIDIFIWTGSSLMRWDMNKEDKILSAPQYSVIHAFLFILQLLQRLEETISLFR